MLSPWLSWDGKPHGDYGADEKVAQEYIVPLPTGQHAIAKEMRMHRAEREEEKKKARESLKRKAEETKKAKKAKKEKKEGCKTQRTADAAAKKAKKGGGDKATRSKRGATIQDKAKVLAGLGELGPTPEKAKRRRNVLYSWAYHANETISKKAGLSAKEMKLAGRRKAGAIVKEHFG